jgi:hypothetical protein
MPQGPDAYAGMGIPPASMQLSPVSEVPDGGADVGLFPPAVPASTELTPVPQGPDVAADMHLAYHANVTIHGAAQISGRVIFIAGFSMCALLAAVLGIVVALCKRKGGIKRKLYLMR